MGNFRFSELSICDEYERPEDRNGKRKANKASSNLAQLEARSKIVNKKGVKGPENPRSVRRNNHGDRMMALN